MPGSARNTTATVIPAMRYRNAATAIEWLCKAFGFEKHLVVPGDNGGIAHAQLTFGNGMIMLGSARDGTPLDVGARCTRRAVSIRDVYPRRSRLCRFRR